MQEPLEIAFHNVESSPSVEAEIRERVAKLDKLYDRLISCRVSVEALHKQHRTGNVYEVHVVMQVPGKDLAVSREPNRAQERFVSPDVYVSLRQAFKAAERQLKAYKEQVRENVVQTTTLFQGQVAEMHVPEEYGYLLTNTGALLYFHRNSVMDGSFETMAQGDVVHYVEAMGEGGPTASKVWRGPVHDLDRAEKPWSRSNAR